MPEPEQGAGCGEDPNAGDDDGRDDSCKAGGEAADQRAQEMQYREGIAMGRQEGNTIEGDGCDQHDDANGKERAGVLGAGHDESPALAGSSRRIPQGKVVLASVIILP
ncbi:MAG: hypothetical protein E6Q98_07665 [Rhodospirillaceae bacterium]|nr:MAG: hypothetical protein E6Q98_07665 [Rhodospirillaceae bacterium]